MAMDEYAEDRGWALSFEPTYGSILGGRVLNILRRVANAARSIGSSIFHNHGTS